MGCCSGGSSISGPRISACHGCGKKKKKKGIFFKAGSNLSEGQLCMGLGVCENSPSSTLFEEPYSLQEEGVLGLVAYLSFLNSRCANHSGQRLTVP